MPEHLDFGQALDALKHGGRIARVGWNGKGMHLYLLPSTAWTGTPMEPCIVMFTAQQKRQPGWLASQADMLAGDWVLL